MTTIDLTFANYFIAGVVLYYAGLFALARFTRKAPTLSGGQLVFVIVVPARNEELVIAETLSSLRELRGHDHRVLVLDDGSTDATYERALRLAGVDTRIQVVRRHGARAGRGKSDVLNHAFRIIGEMIDRREIVTDPSSTIVGILDADGRLERRCLEAVSPFFADPEVGSVQIGVRIGNAASSMLVRLQDMEFVGFTYLVQIARDHLGSSGLGGNGQFTRFSALQSLAREPWSPGALTEDLDLGLSLVKRGWKTRFCSATFVSQQGLPKWRPLLRQRTRWIHGHYQCWKHIPSLLRSHEVRWATRLDLATYLLLVLTVVVVTFNAIVSIASLLGAVLIENRFLDFIPSEVERAFVAELFALFPLGIFMWTYQRHSGHPFRWWEFPAYGLAFTLYSYVWVVATLRAWTRLLLRTGTWTKTPRVVEGTS